MRGCSRQWTGGSDRTAARRARPRHWSNSIRKFACFSTEVPRRGRSSRTSKNGPRVRYCLTTGRRRCRTLAFEVARPRLAPFDVARLPDLKDRQCPFVGLEAFRDPTFFFGRDKAVDSLLERVAEVPLVIVQGASGSGKSSLVIAGTLPKLSAAGRVPRFRVVGPFTPGNTVLESLVGAVAAAVPDHAFRWPSGSRRAARQRRAARRDAERRRGAPGLARCRSV